MSKKIIITTSRRPTRRIRSFCSDLERSIPNSIKITRGKLSFENLIEKALKLEADRLIIVDRWKGGPGKIEFYKLEELNFVQKPPIIYVLGVKLQREFSVKVSTPKSLAVAIDYETSEELLKLAESISDFLSCPLHEAEIEGELNVYGRILRISEGKRAGRMSFFMVPTWIEVGPAISIRHLIWDLK